MIDMNIKELDDAVVLIFSKEELRYNDDDVLFDLVIERVLEKKRQLAPLTEQELKDIAGQIEEAKKTDPVWRKMMAETK